MKQNLPWIFVNPWQILFHTGQVLPIKAFFRQFSNSIGGCLQFSMGLTVTYYHHFLPFSKDYKNFRRFSIDFCNFPGNSKSVTHFPRSLSVIFQGRFSAIFQGRFSAEVRFPFTRLIPSDLYLQKYAWWSDFELKRLCMILNYMPLTFTYRNMPDLVILN